MSEKLLSLSVVSPNLKAPPRQNGESPYLAIVNQTPKYVYPNESFSIQIKLVVPNRCKQPPSAIDIVTSLHYAYTGGSCGTEALLITEPSHVQIRRTENSGCCIVLYKVQMDGIRHDAKVPMYIRFSSRACAFSPTFGVTSINTNPFQLVNYKIRISWKGEWQSEWYKDEGSRKRSIEVHAYMEDRNGVLRTGEQIALRLTLCYFETQSPVVDQDDVLQILGGPTVYIHPNSGMARIRYRVNDVSRKHRNLRFVLLVETEDTYNDVAPEYTPPVKILSKRVRPSRRGSDQETDDSRPTKRRRTPSSSGNDSPDAPSDQDDMLRLVEALRSVVLWADEMTQCLGSIRWEDSDYNGYSNCEQPEHNNISVPTDFIDSMLRRYNASVSENAHGILRNFRWVSHAPPAVHPWSQSSQQGAESCERSVAYILAKPYEGAKTRRYLGLPAYNVDKQILGFYHTLGGCSRPVFSPIGNHKEDIGSFEMEWATSILEREIAQCSRLVLSLKEWGSVDLILEQAFESQRTNGANSAMMQQTPFWRPFQRDFPVYPSRNVQAAHPNEHHYYAKSTPQQMMLPSHAQRPLSAPVFHPPQPPREKQRRREIEVAFVLAKEYKGMNTGRRLGFPAYNANKEILGFYFTVDGSSRREFSPIWQHQQDFGPFGAEIAQATSILEKEILKDRGAVLTLQPGDSIDMRLNQALAVLFEYEETANDYARHQVPA